MERIGTWPWIIGSCRWHVEESQTHNYWTVMITHKINTIWNDITKEKTIELNYVLLQRKFWFLLRQNKTGWCICFLLPPMKEELLKKKQESQTLWCFTMAQRGPSTPLTSYIRCSRKAQRVTLCFYYGMLTSALVNAYLIYIHKMVQRKNKPVNRRINLLINESFQRCLVKSSWIRVTI